MVYYEYVAIYFEFL